jgi:hypothetical protein
MFLLAYQPYLTPVVLDRLLPLLAMTTLGIMWRKATNANLFKLMFTLHNYIIKHDTKHTLGILSLSVVSISFIICRGIPQNSESINHWFLPMFSKASTKSVTIYSYDFSIICHTKDIYLKVLLFRQNLHWYYHTVCTADLLHSEISTS